MGIGLDELGSGAKAAAFENVGDECEGKIILAERRQQTDMDSGELEFWPDGKPKMMTVIVVQTADVTDDDDGQRTIYAKGGKHEVESGKGTSLELAIVEAVKKANASTIDDSGTAVLLVRHTGLGKKKNKGWSAPKLYQARYTPPVTGVTVADVDDL